MRALFFLVMALCLLPACACRAAEGDATSPPVPRKITLTPAEAKWIQQHPVIRVGMDPHWPPYSSINDKGNYDGMDSDLLCLMQGRTGLQFELVRAASWTEVYEKALHGELDMMTGTAETPERARSFAFTNPYFSLPLAIITRTNFPFISSLYDLKGKRVAVQHNYVTTDYIKNNFPGLNLVYTTTIEESMELVAQSKADAMTTNLANAESVIRSHGFSNLKIAGVESYHFDLRYAVRKDWPELRSILEKGLESISAADKQDMYNRWIHVEYSDVIVWDKVWKWGLLISGCLSSLIIVILMWNRRMAVEIERRRRAEHELKETRDRLALLNTEKSNLMNMAAHDLKNPLTGIMMNLEMLGMEAAPSPDALRKTVNEIGGLARRMNHLVSQLLSVNAIEEGRRLLREEVCDLAQLLQEELDEIKVAADKKKIEFDVEWPAEPVLALADGEACVQVMDNLISNAIKFSGRQSHIRVTLMKSDGMAVFSVMDTGPGIPEKERPLLFQKFARLTPQPTAGETSTGLGLSIARGLVEAMNGRIYCESREGHGSTFVVELPAVTTPESGNS